jgi:8-oxo-dGTP diphosphatase
MSEDMERIKEVTAAIICKNEKILIARRAAGENMAGGWEFPGGKLEKGETPEECLERELSEEFGVAARVGDFFCESIYRYPKGTIRLLAYFAEIVRGEIGLSVHDKIAWVTADEIRAYDLLPADIPIAEKLAGGHDI